MLYCALSLRDPLPGALGEVPGLDGRCGCIGYLPVIVQPSLFLPLCHRSQASPRIALVSSIPEPPLGVYHRSPQPTFMRAALWYGRLGVLHRK